MGLSDKLKDIRKQAQGAVAERKDGLQNAVGAVGSAANERTHGKYADRIARVGDKLSETVEKLGGADAAGESAASEQPGVTPEDGGAAQSAAASPSSSDADTTVGADVDSTGTAGSEAKPAGAPPEFE